MSSSITQEKPATVATPTWHAYEIHQLLFELNEKQGIPLDLLLEGTGMTADDLQNPAQLIPLPQELKLYARIANLNRDPLLSLRQGKRLGINSIGVLGQAMLGANTLRDALQLAVKFSPLINWAAHMGLGTEVFQGQSMVCLTMQPSPADACTAQFEVENTFASFSTILHQIVAEPVQFEAVFFSYPCQMTDNQAFSEFFRCPVFFNSSHNKLLLSQSTVSRPLPYAEPEYAVLFHDLCEKRARGLRGERGLLFALRGFVETYDQGVPSIEEAASYFNISSRTLSRRLGELGTSYQTFIDDIRLARAKALLNSTSMTVESIAHSLGYRDVRSFRTAFKKWTGVTPNEYRLANDTET